MGKSKSPPPAPAPVTTPVTANQVEPIQRTATSAAAAERAQNNNSAELLAPANDEAEKKTGQAGMMG